MEKREKKRPVQLEKREKKRPVQLVKRFKKRLMKTQAKNRKLEKKMQQGLDVHTTPLWKTVICDLEAVKAGKEEPLVPGMLGSRQMETSYTLLREDLHRPMGSHSCQLRSGVAVLGPGP